MVSGLPLGLRAGLEHPQIVKTAVMVDYDLLSRCHGRFPFLAEESMAG